jgi:hypothetical protein
MGAQVVGSVSIAASSTMQWFIHGYSAFDVVHFSLSVFGGLGNHADATLVQGEKILHVDLTQGYLVSITNNVSYDSCTAYLLANVETAPTS